jgi:Arc/MetJ-type ribon-helix-helix transcriptional regulator
MGRRPTKTVRVDMQTHDDLKALASKYRQASGRYHSLADMIRIGLTLSATEHERKEDARGRHRAPPGGDA